MKKRLIERYTYDDPGYYPFLIRKGWQVAKLNYMPEQDMEGIQKIDRHNETDEVFVLLNGTAVLIGASVNGSDIKFECVNMLYGVTYNIPAGCWHNIAMQEDAELLIIEKDRTHIDDFEFIHLEGSTKKKLGAKIREALN